MGWSYPPQPITLLTNAKWQPMSTVELIRCTSYLRQVTMCGRENVNPHRINLCPDTRANLTKKKLATGCLVNPTKLKFCLNSFNPSRRRTCKLLRKLAEQHGAFHLGNIFLKKNNKKNILLQKNNQLLKLKKNSKNDKAFQINLNFCSMRESLKPYKAD